MKFTVFWFVVLLILLPASATVQRSEGCSNCPPEECVQCFVNPCTHTRCDLGPGIKLRCRPDYCRGCFAKFYYGSVDMTDFCRVVPNKP